MGFDMYDGDALRRIVDHWRRTETTPGSMGDKAKREAMAEWERREAARRHPAAGGEGRSRSKD